ncbi:Lymphocyte activation gene 3 protein [Oryzias melastigma]|uniref:Lymphocyte activation gene 3 protein n=1 Tax=Oryzias melastigma TaxID=30732 RepID=A0A834FJJ8_ORYME|nr:Lymphocyte activation gene 3 protein [Oryzias melastigma]
MLLIAMAVLPCKCSPLRCSTAAIIWSKDNRGTLWRKERSGLQYWGSSWMGKEGARVQCPHAQFDKGDCNLHINRVTESDGGLYTCRVHYGNQFAENRVFLRVVQVSISPAAPLWGQDVSITCRVNPWPTEGSVSWMLNNRRYTWKNKISSNGEQSVVKEIVTERVVGNWTCVVDSTKEWRYALPLSVRGITKPPKDDTLVYAALGSAVTLPCVFSAGLSPKETAWEKVGFGNLDLNRQSLSSWDQSVTINEVELKDQGKYRCAGSINGKRLTRTMQLVVAKIIQAKRKGFVMLTCQLTDTSQDTEYEWVPAKYDLNGTLTEGRIQRGQSFVMEDNWDEVTCRYYGKQGLLGNVTHHHQVMSAQSKEDSKERSYNTGTIIGLSFLLVILLLVLAQMFRNFQRRKRIFQYPALETIVHTISNEREERERRTQTKKVTTFQEEIQ